MLKREPEVTNKLTCVYVLSIQLSVTILANVTARIKHLPKAYRPLYEACVPK